MRRLLAGLVLVVLGALAALPANAATTQRVPVRVGEHPGFSRVVFDWHGKARAALQEQTAGRAVIRFDRPGALDLSRFDGDPPPGVRTLVPISAADGLHVAVTFAEGSRLRLFESDGSIVLDVLAPPAASEASPPPEPSRKPQAAAEAPTVSGEPIRSASAPKPAGASAAPDGPAAQGAAQGPIQLLRPAEPPPPTAKAQTEPPSPVAKAPAAPPPPAAKAPADQASLAAKAPANPPSSAAKAQAAPPLPAAKPETKRAETAPPATPPGNFAQSPWQAAELRGQTSPGNAGAIRKAQSALPRVKRAAPEEILASRTLDLGGPLALRFPFSAPTAAAAFRRGPYLWLAFDRNLPADLVAKLDAEAPELAPFSRYEVPGGTLVRMMAPGLRQPYLLREGQDWVVEIASAADRAPEEPRVEVDGAAQPAEVRFHLAEPGAVISFTDPDYLDRIAVVPLRRAGIGLRRMRAYPQFRALESLQGLVLQPLSDGFAVTVDGDVAQVRDSDGLIVSYGGTLALSPSHAIAPRRGPRLFDLDAWRRGGTDRYQVNRHALLSDLARAAPGRLDVARQTLERFYFAHGMASETLGLLALRAESDARLTRGPEAVLLAGASEFLEGDYTPAAKHILDPILDGESEAELWRAALATVGLDWGTAVRLFDFADPLIAAYPRPVRTRLRLLAAEANLAVEDGERAEAYLDQVRADHPNRLEAAQLAFLVGRQRQLAGDVEAARKIWQRVAQSDDSSARARARLALLDLDYGSGAIDEDQLIAELERLRFAWRGDHFEFTVIRRLAELYFDRGRYRDGLRALREVASRVDNAGLAQAAAQRMRGVFTQVFLDKSAAPLAPLKALALYDEFKELTPTGPDGDRIVASLAERLIAVDLLDRAAQMLETQVDYRLTGSDKARAGLRLAQVDLLNRQPEKALDALARSEMAGLPDELSARRRRVEARALLEAGRADEALAALGGDTTTDGQRLRADILWRQQDWTAAALVLEQLVPETPPGRPLKGDESEAVMNLAVALTMAGDGQRLTKLAKAYDKAMQATPRGSAFAVLVHDPGTGTAEPVARQLAEVAQFETFLSDYRAQVQAGTAN